MNIELKDIHLLFNESSGTKARSFTARFLECGLVSYDGEGLGKALLKKENIDKFINKMVNCPLIIKHNEVNGDNVDKLAVGWITQVSYNDVDGWYYCNGIITDEDGIEKAKDFGYVSCAVVPLDVDKSGGVWHDIKYDFEVLDADFNHLALVPNPRYGDATILLNSKMEKLEKKTSTFKERFFNWLANESGSDNEKKEDGTLVNESEKKEEKKDEEEKDTKDMENLKNSLKNSLSLKNKSMLKNEDLEALKKLSAYDLVKTMMEEADFHKDAPVSEKTEKLENESDKEDKKEEKSDKKEDLKSCNNASDEDKKEEEKKEEKEEKKETLENSSSLGKQLKNSFEEDKPAKTYMSKVEGLELAKKLGL